MKRLLLLRHAKAVPADGASPDLARALAERGERDARHIGERMRQRHACPDLIVASPALRTHRTAQLVAAAFGYEPERIALDARLYLAAADEISAVIAAQKRTVDCLLVVGHNPGLSELAQSLLPDVVEDDLPTGGVVAIDIDSERWADLGRATRTFVYYDFPKNRAAPTRAR
jgi:phosphohistidine phosphatase